jgi:SAM-dependent methyltransferase
VDERLLESYDDFPRIEEEFRRALDESLEPRGPDLLYDLVRRLALPPGSVAVDAGCGIGRHSRRLADEFGFEVIGIDPVPRNVEVAAAEPRHGLRYELGSVEVLPLPDESVDLVWCRDVLVLVDDLDRAYAEFRRVLRADGRAVVYVMLGTDRLPPDEARRLWASMGVVAESLDPARTEVAIARSGLRVVERIDIGGEWSEWAQERSGEPGRRLLHAARLLRDPDRYSSRFGRSAYEIMLGDCLWHVYAAIGKLERRAYVLAR